METRRVRVAVIGAGQAGLSAAYHLRSRGLRPWEDFLVLDANEGPGGAWRHRWDSLTFDRAHGIHPLPDGPWQPPDPSEPAHTVVPRYYGAYERDHDLPVLRPAEVLDVVADDGGFVVVATDHRIRTETVINATGTWDSPYLPYYPGLQRFGGLQVHTHDYRSARDFEGARVLVVGGGTSALQFLQELDTLGIDTVWATRRAPQWTARSFDQEWGLDVERSVADRTSRGLAPLSVSAATGIPLNDLYVPDIASGLLLSRGRPVRFDEYSVVLDGPGPDGAGLPDQGEATAYVTDPSAGPTLPGHSAGSDALWEVPIDAILWATGFRAHIRHLRHLDIREPGGGVLMGRDGVTVVKQPGLFMAGYGASASTLGATRAGRRAALRALRHVGERRLTA